MRDGGAVDGEAGGGQYPGPGACRYFSHSVVDGPHGTVQPNSAGELGTKDLYVGELIVIHTFIASVWLLRLLS